MSIRSAYSISDLEVLSQVKRHTIRMWERRYGLLDPQRTETNIRTYSNEDLKRLLNVSLLNRHGVKISRIAAMPTSDIRRAVLDLNTARANAGGAMDTLVLAMLDLDEMRFNAAIDACAERTGLERAFTEVVFPFFERIGVMWQVGAIDPAQEHFISHIVRHRLISATPMPGPVATKRAPAVLLLLPEHELHELGLLFYHFALRKRGRATVYLGQAVPLESLERSINIVRPGALVLSLTSSMADADIRTLVRTIAAMDVPKVLVTGQALMNYRGKLPIKVRRFNDMTTLLEVLA